MDSVKEVQECPDCAGTNIVFSEVREQLICRDCGLIFEPLIKDAEDRFERSHGISRAGKKAPEKKHKKAKKAPAMKKARKKK